MTSHQTIFMEKPVAKDYSMEKIWLSHYPQGVSDQINLYPYDSLVDFISQQCQRYAKLPAFENFGTTLSFEDLDHLSLQFASYLQQDLKLKKGDRFAIMLPNVMQFPIALYGALRAGLIVVNINPLYTATELKHQIDDSGAKAIIVMENFAATVSKVLPLDSLQHVIITRMGDCLSWTKKHLIHGYLKYKKAIPRYYIKGAIFYHDIMKQKATRNFSPVNIDLNDVAFLQYTGGTTGIAKGAILTHSNILANVLQCLEWLKPKLQEGKDVVVMPLPLYHIFSLTSCFFFIAVGAKSLLISDPRNIPQFIKLLRHCEFHILLGLNTLFNALMHHPKFEKIDFSTVKFVFSGGMPLQQSVAERWQAITNVVITEGYGLTEASPVVTINPLTLQSFKASIGMPIPVTEISIRDADKQELPIGEVGELLVRGPQVMQGYWNNLDETAYVLSEDGWLSTGDMARIDEQGMLYIIERKKDMILVSGFNVYPNEIEAVLTSHSQIKEAAVIGVADEKTGEAIKAFIVLEETISVKEIKAFASNYLTAYKIPKEIVFCDDLPKSPVGKVLRRMLR